MLANEAFILGMKACTKDSLVLCAGSYASWLAGDNLAPAANAALGTVGGKVPSLKQRASGFAANGGAATLAVQKVADALKVTWPPLSALDCLDRLLGLLTLCCHASRCPGGVQREKAGCGGRDWRQRSAAQPLLVSRCLHTCLASGSCLRTTQGLMRLADLSGGAVRADPAPEREHTRGQLQDGLPAPAHLLLPIQAHLLDGRPGGGLQVSACYRATSACL